MGVRSRFRDGSEDTVGSSKYGRSPLDIASPSGPGRRIHSPPALGAEAGAGVAHIHYVRAIYVAMLGCMPVQEILGFWKSHPLQHRGEWLSGADLFRWIWDCRGVADLDWVAGVLRDAERFCVDQGIDFQSLAARMNSRINGTSCLSGRAILTSMRPLAPLLFQTSDPYRLALALLPAISKAHLPDAIHECLPVKEKNGGQGMAILFALDRTYSGRFACDYHFLGGMALKSAPGIFGVAPFSEVTPLSDCRSVPDVLWEGKFLRKRGEVYLDGVQVGESIGFFEYLATRGLDLSGLGIPDREVILIHRGVECGRRKRTVLHPGCAYGAPVYLSLLRHPESEITGAGLGPIITDMHASALQDPSEIRTLHMALLAQSGKTPCIIYHLESQTLTYDGETLIKGLPTVILRRAIIEFQSTGRNIFTNREFKEDGSRADNPLKGNFESNLSRLKSRLTARNTCIRIENAGRGKFRLASSGDFTYKEVCG